MEKKIKELQKVVSALIQLALETGTLLAVIKMIVESLQSSLGEVSLLY